MHKYRLMGKKGEGTFSEVLKAQCIKNGKQIAIKCNQRESAVHETSHPIPFYTPVHTQALGPCLPARVGGRRYEEPL